MIDYDQVILALFCCVLIIKLASCQGFQSISPKTSAVLRISYDGILFNGWSAGNDGSITNLPADQNLTFSKRGRSRRNRNNPSVKKGEVRSVQGTIRAALAKLYGNVDVERVVVEGSSRTDSGVSCRYMIALVYCLNDENESCSSNNNFFIEGKKLPHPLSATDDGFKPLPFKSDLKQLLFALNKMLPPDVRIMDASYMPIQLDNNEYIKSKRPFHPSLDSNSKTYTYKFSIGELYDPIHFRHVWHIANAKTFNIVRAQECASILCGKHDFVAFRGSFRGNERGKLQDTVCNLQSIEIDIDSGSVFSQSIRSCSAYKITFKGDRYLYKMVRFLVGTIIQYGLNEERPFQEVRDALSFGAWNDSDCDSKFPRLCAPSNGLLLDYIDYGENWTFNWIVSK